MHDEGISRSGGILDLGVESGILERAGSWITYGSEKIGQGRESAREFLRSNTKVSSEIEKRIRESMLAKTAGKK